MGCAGGYRKCAANFDKCLCSTAESTRGVNHIVHDDALFALNVADDVHNFRNVRFGTAFVDYSERNVELFGKFTNTVYAAMVGRNCNVLILVMVNNGLEIRGKNWSTHKVVNRNIKKSLNLCSMKIHCKDSVRSCGCKHICHNLCRNRVPCLCFSVLAGISEIRDNGGDSSGRGPAESVNHYDKLHKVVIYRVAGGLHDKYIGTADGFFRRNGNFAVCKMTYSTFAKRKPKVLCNIFRCFRIRVAGKNFNVLPVDIHFCSLLLTHGVLFLSFLAIKNFAMAAFAAHYLIFIASCFLTQSAIFSCFARPTASA